jgi:hypothetical protein
MAYLYEFDAGYVSDEDSDYSYESDADDDNEYISDTDSFVNEDDTNDPMIVESSDEPIGIPTHVRVRKPSWSNNMRPVLVTKPVRDKKPPVRYQA